MIAPECGEENCERYLPSNFTRLGGVAIFGSSDDTVRCSAFFNCKSKIQKDLGCFYKRGSLINTLQYDSFALSDR